MKKAQSVGLVAAGNLTDSPLTRFRWASQGLGPVKSGSVRVASRIANMLKAGHPVKDYAELGACTLILICVPEDSLSGIIAGLLSAEIDWREKIVVLFSAALDSGELREFSQRGAAVGSITPIPGFEDERYLVEGDPPAIRSSKRLVEFGERRAIAIERPAKPLFLVALTCTGTLLFALISVADESLRHARIPNGFAATLLERQIIRTLRAYLKGGRRAYTGTDQLHRQLRALLGTKPELALYLEQSYRLASRLMEDSD
jgi:hypothetical protein